MHHGDVPIENVVVSRLVGQDEQRRNKEPDYDIGQ